MTKRFVVALDSGTESQNKAFLDFINSKGFGWWHWIDNFWLIDAGDTTTTASEFSNQLTKSHPSINHFVMELTPSGETWSGFGPNSKERNMFDWLNNNWKK